MIDKFWFYLQVNLKSSSHCREALESIANAVKNDDVSPFELIHSGVIEKLLTYLTTCTEIPASSSTTISDLVCVCAWSHIYHIVEGVNI